MRLALDHPDLVSRLVLCWPATAGDRRVDERQRRVIDPRAGPETADRLLSGETQRGVDEAELRSLAIPVTLVPCEPENPLHRRETVRGLSELIPGARAVRGTPESPRPEFAAARARFLSILIEALAPSP